MLTAYKIEGKWVLGDAYRARIKDGVRGLCIDPIRSISSRTADKMVKSGEAATFSQAFTALYDAAAAASY